MTPAAETSGTVNDGIIEWLNLTGTTPQGTVSGVTALKSNQIAADAAGVDFLAFDTNQTDGIITSDELTVIIILAGYEEAYGVDASGTSLGNDSTSPRTWGHAWNFGVAVASPTVDTVTFGSSGGSYQLYNLW